MTIARFDSFASAPQPSLATQGQLRKLHKLDFMETVAVRQAAMRIGEWELTATGFEELLGQFKELSWSLYCYAISQRNSWAVLVYKTLGMALGSFLAGKLPLTHDNVRHVRQLAWPTRG